MRTPRILTALAVLALAGMAAGQVRLSQGGRALDANYLVGGGRFNSVRSTERSFNGNLFMTRQVTGGFQFRGDQPFAAANQLRLDVPSADLDDFISGSMGVQQVTSGIRYGPQRFLSASRTVVSAGGISRGQNAPGTSIPRSAYIPPSSAERLYNLAIRPYQPVLGGQGLRLHINPLIKPVSAARPVQGVFVSSALASERGAARPVASGLFGITRESDRKRQAEELARAAVRSGMDRDADSRIQTQNPGQAQAWPADEPSFEAAEPKSDYLLTPKPGSDVFLDMLLTMRRRRQERDEQAKAARGRVPPIVRPRIVEPERGGEPGQIVPGEEEESSELFRPTAAGARQAKDRIVIRNLAGKNRDLFNINMTRAENALAEGRFYTAARFYDVAGMINRGNPLAPLGEALALLGADEPLSSAIRLRRAMDRFPPLMEMKVDIVEMMGEKIVKQRIRRIEKQLIEGDGDRDRAMVFLAAFIRSSMGQSARAARHAAMLKELAGKDGIYRLYADRLLKIRAEEEKPAQAK